MIKKVTFIFIVVISILFSGCFGSSTGNNSINSGANNSSGIASASNDGSSGFIDGNGNGYSGGNGNGYSGNQIISLKNTEIRCSVISTEKNRLKENETKASFNCYLADSKGSVVTKKREHETLKWLPPVVEKMEVKETVCSEATNQLNFSCKLTIDSSNLEEENVEKILSASIEVSAEIKDSTPDITIKSSTLIIEVSYDTGGFPMLQPLYLNTKEDWSGTLNIPVTCESDGNVGKVTVDTSHILDSCNVSEENVLTCTPNSNATKPPYYDEFGNYIDFYDVIAVSCTTDGGKLTRVQKVGYTRIVPYPMVFTSQPMTLTEGDSSGWNYECTGEGGCTCELTAFGVLAPIYRGWGVYGRLLTEPTTGNFKADASGIDTLILEPDAYRADFTCHDIKGRTIIGSVPLSIEKGDIAKFLTLQHSRIPGGVSFTDVPNEVLVPYDTGFEWPWYFACTSNYGNTSISYSECATISASSGYSCPPWSARYENYNEIVSCTGVGRTLSQTIRITAEPVPAPTIIAPDEVVVPFGYKDSTINVPINCNSNGRFDPYDAIHKNSAVLITEVGPTSMLSGFVSTCEVHPWQPTTPSYVTAVGCNAGQEHTISVTCRDTYPLTGAFSEARKLIHIKMGADVLDSNSDGTTDSSDYLDTNYPMYNDLRKWSYVMDGEGWFSNYIGRTAVMHISGTYYEGYFRGNNEFVSALGIIYFRDNDGDGKYDFFGFEKDSSYGNVIIP